MNDRFRYRVWDKENKCMHYPIRYGNFSIVNGTVVKIESYPTANSAYLGKRIAWEFDDAIIMQCTGLKDKNGKLIYEGDIVKINTHFNHLVYDDYEYDCESEKGYSLFKIIYDDDMARFGAERIKCVKWETHHYSLNYVPHNHKVIGNIYENKELLESEGQDDRRFIK